MNEVNEQLKLMLKEYQAEHGEVLATEEIVKLMQQSYDLSVNEAPYMECFQHGPISTTVCPYCALTKALKEL